MAPVDWILIGGCRLDSNRIKPKHDESCFWLIFEGAQLGLCLARFIDREFVLSSGLYRQVELDLSLPNSFAQIWFLCDLYDVV